MKQKPAQRVAGVIRERLASFEESQRIGIPQQTLVDQLNQEGFAVSLATFRNGLFRARKALGKTTKAAEKASAAKPMNPVRQGEAKQPSPVENLNQHGGFTMPAPLDPKELY